MNTIYSTTVILSLPHLATLYTILYFVVNPKDKTIFFANLHSNFTAFVNCKYLICRLSNVKPQGGCSACLSWESYNYQSFAYFLEIHLSTSYYWGSLLLTALLYHLAQLCCSIPSHLHGNSRLARIESLEPSHLCPDIHIAMCTCVAFGIPSHTPELCIDNFGYLLKFFLSRGLVSLLFHPTVVP